tara:strand:- start:92 stop:442 length:351 start_codon:yes stop_codon:yes gene_type:complete
VEEAFGGFAISPERHQNIDHVSILIHRSPQIVSLAPDRDKELVNMPDVAQASLLPAHTPSIVGAKLAAPSPNRLIGDGDPSLGEQVLDVSKAEGEAVIKPHRVADNLRWKAMTAIS